LLGSAPIVQFSYTKPSNIVSLFEEEQKKLEDSEQKDAQALFVLQQVMGETIVKMIIDAKI